MLPETCPPLAMPRPSASATASRSADHWVADALAADDALDFSSIMALLDATPECLAGAPESVAERVALRCLQELSEAAIGDGSTASRAAAGVLRVDITRSCEDLLLQIIGEVGTSGSLRKDMLPAFNQDIQNIICTKKPGLPETCFELLREMDEEIACMAFSSVEQNGDNEHDCLNIEEPRFLPDNAILRVENLANLVNQTCKENKESIEPTSDLQQECISDTIIPQVNSNKTHLSSLQHDSGERANQDLNYEGTSIQPVEKEVHEELAQRADCILASVRCNGAIQGDKSETDHLLGNRKEHGVLYEDLNDGNCHLEVCCADKVNQSVFSVGGILEKNMAVCGGPNVQSASNPRSRSVALHTKIAEDGYSSEQNNANRTTDVHKISCSLTVPIPPRDGDGRRAKQISSKETHANTAVEISHVHSSDDNLSGFADNMIGHVKDQGTNSSPRGCSEKDLCIKCGKDDQLLKCSSCFLAAHESCFGTSVIFEDTGKFCCPVCFYTKATEAYKEAKKTYSEARRNLAAFLGTQRLVNQHDEQPPEVLPRASPSKGHLNEYNSVKRKSSNHTETQRLACSDDKADQQRKKQKTNVTVDTSPEEAVTGKASPARNSGVEPMNRHSVVQNISKQVHDAEKEQEVENKEAGNENSCDETRSTCHEKIGPSATNKKVESGKEDGLTNSNQSENSGETEAISLNDSGQQSLPPLHNIRHRKAKLQERETTVSCNSGKAVVQHGQHMPSPSRKRNYAYPINRPSGSVAPTGRRSKLSWTNEEEEALREAMEKFNTQDNRPIPWTQILEYGRDVFHRARVPSDLRVKWRHMMKKTGS